jgi:hypothetical protein
MATFFDGNFLIAKFLSFSLSLSRSYYSKSNEGWGYKLPIAYFLAGVVVYIYSFAATLRKYEFPYNLL